MSSYGFVLSALLVFGSDTSAVVENKWQGRKRQPQVSGLEAAKGGPREPESVG